MKRKITIFLILFPIILFSQEEFKVEKIDNSNFPFIKVYVRTNNKLNLEKLYFEEKNNKIEYSCDTIVGKNLGRGSLSVLFVIDKKIQSENIKLLIKSIKSLSRKDKINLAILVDKDTTKYTMQYLSPCFSDNHNYFIDLLHKKLTQNVNYDAIITSKNEFNKVERKILQSQDIYSNKAVVFFINDFKRSYFSSKLISKPKVPIYFLLSNQPDTIIQKKLSDICTQSGGIYSVSEPNNYYKHLSSYIEDISYNKNLDKNEMLVFTFKTSQNKSKNLFNIKYNNQTYQYSFNMVKSSYLTNREQVLLMFSALLLIVLFIIIYKNKRAINKIQLNQIKDFKPSSAIPVKNIEINVKTKGFNKTYFFEKHIIRIGRGEDNDIVIPDRTVSVYHALINREGNEFMLQDLGSTNGVLINQKKIKKQSLKTNDKIKMGAAILIVRV